MPARRSSPAPEGTPLRGAAILRAGGLLAMAEVTANRPAGGRAAVFLATVAAAMAPLALAGAAGLQELEPQGLESLLAMAVLLVRVLLAMSGFFLR